MDMPGSFELLQLEHALRVIGAPAFVNLNAVMIVYRSGSVHVNPAAVEVRLPHQTVTDARRIVEIKHIAVALLLITDADDPVSLN